MEFIIKRNDGEWFDLDKDEYDDVLKPNSYNYDIIDGWGNHRIKVNNCEISFSFEFVGFQICFEDEPGESITDEDAEIIIKEILSNIEQSTKQKGIYYRI